METHPGWEVMSDSEDSGDDSQDDDGNYTFKHILLQIESNFEYTIIYYLRPQKRGKDTEMRGVTKRRLKKRKHGK